ncbi:MAG: hypothetical protein Kow0075_14150 [Salibacteraceae bacterium]
MFDWLAGIAPATKGDAFAEIRFKNTRKEFYQVPDGMSLCAGEAVVVDAVGGYDVGLVSLTGELVRIQMKKYGVKPDSRSLRKVIRKATDADIEQWRSAQSREREALVKARKIIRDMNLDMKLSDVEYQADGTRATFYYIADGRVDFRQLIRVLAERFRIRVEMRQIGSRQEAGLVGGIGSCGRELCCSTWLTDFRTVTTSAARYQQLSINPMKIAGQCGKLKCCLNYELDSYLDAIKEFPDHKVKLKTKKGLATHQKSDIFKGLMWYAYDDAPSEFIALKVDRVMEVMEMNKKGKAVDDLKSMSYVEVKGESAPNDFDNVVGQDDLTRFDKADKPKRNKKRRKNRDGRRKKKQ